MSADHSTSSQAELPPGGAPPSFATRLVLTLIVVFHLALSAWSAARHSPTLNEPGHLAAGLSIWKYKRFDLYCVNPPLVRMAAAIPLLFVDHQENWSRYRSDASSRSEWNVGQDFIEANGEHSLWLTTLARWACLPFSLIGLLVCWRWGRELFGETGGLAAAALWAFSPNVLGHSSLITPDIPAVALGLLAAWRFASWLERPGWENAILAGLSLGLALLSKTYWIILLGIWPGIWLADWLRRWIRRRTAPPNATAGPVPFVQLLTVLMIGLHLLNSGYHYGGTGTPLGDFGFYSKALAGETRDPHRDVPGNRFQGTFWEWVPVPLPRDYVIGIDIQKRDFERTLWNYLLGEWRREGWWYFYVVGLFAKVPIGTWLLVLLGVFRLVRRPDGLDILRQLCPLVLPAFTVFLLASMQTGMQHHVRYVYAMLPVLFLLASSTFAGTGGAAWSNAAAYSVVGGVCLLGSVLGSLAVYPHSLSYFNELVGGSARGPEILLHSNYDWGQDLIHVKEWIEAHPDRRPVTVGTQPHLPLRDIGIDADRTPPGPPPPGWHLVSRALIRDNRSPLRRFAELVPVERVGGTMEVYQVSGAENLGE